MTSTEQNISVGKNEVPSKPIDPSISFFGTIITSLVVSSIVCLLVVVVYHRHFTPTLMTFDSTGFTDQMEKDLDSGKLKREDIGLVLARMEEKIDKLPKRAIVFEKSALLSDARRVEDE